jgi:hypothetical protein
VHCPDNDLHARVSLWWSDGVVHPGDHVGPPRGGLVPGRHPSYRIALPAGGYLIVEDGVLVGWSGRHDPTAPIVRADGQQFDIRRHSKAEPYFRDHYQQMKASDVRAALAERGPTALGGREVAGVLGAISAATDPVVCGCTGRTPTAQPPPLTLVVPEPLLLDAGTLRVLVGEADAVESVATLWRLSGAIWDPARVGRARAAEADARNSGESARGWPLAPVTEQAVAQIAAQAVRHHGAALVHAMPAWLLGWVMIAGPVLSAGQRADAGCAAALDAADRVRVARVETQWQAAAAARALLHRSSSELQQIDDPESVVWSEGRREVDLRQPNQSRPDRSDEQVAGMTLRDAAELAYRCDVRTWLSVLAEQA